CPLLELRAQPLELIDDAGHRRLRAVTASHEVGDIDDATVGDHTGEHFGSASLLEQCEPHASLLQGGCERRYFTRAPAPARGLAPRRVSRPAARCAPACGFDSCGRTAAARTWPPRAPRRLARRACAR